MVSCKNKMATLVVTTALGFSVGLVGCASTDGNSATGMADDTEVTKVAGSNSARGTIVLGYH